MPKLIVIPLKCDQGRGEAGIGHERTNSKVMDKKSILVWNNRKFKRTILYDLRCTLPKKPIKQCWEGLTKFGSMFEEF